MINKPVLAGASLHQETVNHNIFNDRGTPAVERYSRIEAVSPHFRGFQHVAIKKMRYLGGFFFVKRFSLFLRLLVHHDRGMGRSPGAQHPRHTFVIGRSLFQGQQLAIIIEGHGQPVRMLVSAARFQRIQSRPETVAVPFVPQRHPSARQARTHKGRFPFHDFRRAIEQGLPGARTAQRCVVTHGAHIKIAVADLRRKHVVVHSRTGRHGITNDRHGPVRHRH
ncbi:MAG: hypothetical protein BWY09_03023 [Candidatus Hydrogenedentes bacterium ADurb.Bin179]|nr:MAG: hypothetical protein BWY09_03023 [Candidatus Hydrogenedentes bacterium ADurb.Bin179]